MCLKLSFKESLQLKMKHKKYSLGNSEDVISTFVHAINKQKKPPHITVQWYFLLCLCALELKLGLSLSCNFRVHGGFQVQDSRGHC